MPLSKAEMMALLPDNSTGQIRAKTMRDIVTDLSSQGYWWRPSGQ